MADYNRKSIIKADPWEYTPWTGSQGRHQRSQSRERDSRKRYRESESRTRQPYSPRESIERSRHSSKSRRDDRRSSDRDSKRFRSQSSNHSSGRSYYGSTERGPYTGSSSSTSEKNTPRSHSRNSNENRLSSSSHRSSKKLSSRYGSKERDRSTSTITNESAARSKNRTPTSESPSSNDEMQDNDSEDPRSQLSVQQRKNQLREKRIAENGFKLYCPICIVYLNTSREFESHIVSEKHIQRDREQKLKPISTKPIPKKFRPEKNWSCDVCGIPKIPSIEGYNAHVMTVRHHSLLLESLHDGVVVTEQTLAEQDDFLEVEAIQPPIPEIDWINYEEEFKFPFPKITDSSPILSMDAILLELKHHQQMSMELQILYKQVETNTSDGEDNNFVIKNKLLCVGSSKDSVLYMVPKSAVKLILYNHHKSNTGEHFSVGETVTKISQNFIWTNLYENAVSYIKACEQCHLGSEEKLLQTDLSTKTFTEAIELYNKCSNLKFEEILMELKVVQNADEKLESIKKSVVDVESKKDKTNYDTVNEILGINNPDFKYLVPEVYYTIMVERFHALDHLDIPTTYLLISKLFHWDSMYWDVINFIMNCKYCKKPKSKLQCKRTEPLTFDDLLYELKKLQTKEINRNNIQNYSEYELKDNVLTSLKTGRYFVPNSARIMILNHYSSTSLKLNLTKLLKLFYWDGIYEDIYQYVSQCNDQFNPQSNDQQTEAPDPIYVKVETDVIKDIIQFQRNDKYCTDLIKNIKTNKIDHMKCIVKNNLLAVQTEDKIRYVIPTLYVNILIKQYHENVADHLNHDQTFNVISYSFYWVEMEKNIKQYIQQCEKCHPNYLLTLQKLPVMDISQFLNILTIGQVSSELSEIYKQVAEYPDDVTSVDGVKYTIYKNLLVRVGDLIVVPKKYINFVLYIRHYTQNTSDHVLPSTFRKIRKNFYWESLETDVNNYLAACEVCKMKNVNVKKKN